MSVVDIHLNDPRFLADRRESYRKLRQTNPVARTLLNGEESVVLTRYRDIENLLRDARAVMQPEPGAFPRYLGDGPAAKFYRLSLPSVDNPVHKTLRQIVSPAFSTQAVSRMEEWVNSIIEARIDEIEGGEIIDVVTALGDAIPLDVACRLMQVPRPDAAMLLARINDVIAILSQADLTAEELARGDESAALYIDYFAELVDGGLALLEDDVIGALAHGAARGDITRDDAAIVAIDIFIGSYHTTMVGLSNALGALAKHPDQLRALAREPARAGRAWEEMLRYEPPVHFRHRFVSAPMSFSGETVQPGVKIMIALASANWDEEIFEAPDAFNIDRPPARHLTFGGGGHFCLGAQLSRLEGRIFLPTFLRRFPFFTLAEPPVRNENMTFPYYERLAIEIERAR